MTNVAEELVEGALEAEAALTEEELEAQLPKPVGYRILIALPQVEEKFEGSELIKTSQIKHQEQVLSIIGAVIDMGSECYGDKERFPTGPWCQVGDFVMFRANSGTRFKIGGTEYRLMNDDNIEAVVADPRGITRA